MLGRRMEIKTRRGHAGIPTESDSLRLPLVPALPHVCDSCKDPSKYDVLKLSGTGPGTENLRASAVPGGRNPARGGNMGAWVSY